MSPERSEVLSDHLDDLGRRIERAMQALEAKGGAMHDEGAALKELRERQKATRKKLETDVRDRHLWDLLKQEVEMDLEALQEDVIHWERRLDAQAMRRQG